ncbi:MAG TPA: helix-turn-helix transcriptional regulator [Aequorivita sp.]|nr:helix-turn-helix transcriptional regulator [Aequorivita sp.]
MGFGKKLKVLLKENGLSQLKYAEEISENLTQVNKVLNEERSPSFDMIQKTIAYFDKVDLNWFFRDEYETGDIIPKVNEKSPNYSTDIIRDIMELEIIVKSLKRRVSQ